MKDLIQNQIALALIVFIVIIVMTYLFDAANAKEVVIQIITAVGSLVTGYSMGKRSTDKE